MFCEDKITAARQCIAEDKLHFQFSFNRDDLEWYTIYTDFVNTVQNFQFSFNRDDLREIRVFYEVNGNFYSDVFQSSFNRDLM